MLDAAAAPEAPVVMRMVLEQDQLLSMQETRALEMQESADKLVPPIFSLRGVHDGPWTSHNVSVSSPKWFSGQRSVGDATPTTRKCLVLDAQVGPTGLAQFARLSQRFD